ncbi:thioesterase II family protein [Streptomyces sp. GSL17-111]|uniref:thioesterase II family protein n=1 Tax=Streptomyces sp. GSL17-111 TaxID=3121596 RepID=UPI0030F49BF5
MSAASGHHDRWLRRFEPAPEGATRLLALPHAGGSAPYFLPLARALAPELDVVCAQYPGRQDRYREALLDNVEAFVDGLFEALTSEPAGPLVLFGHSMGAILAYELGLRIERQGGADLLGVIASGRRSPTRHRADDAVHLRDDDGIIAEIRELNGTDPGVLNDDELLRMVLPALRTDYRAVETYRHRPEERLRAPLSVLTGESDPHVTQEEARAWQELTDGDFRYQSFPGGHFYLGTQQAAVTEAIRRSIAAFRPTPSPTTP